jgi:hypothetical protein
LDENEETSELYPLDEDAEGEEDIDLTVAKALESLHPPRDPNQDLRVLKSKE